LLNTGGNRPKEKLSYLKITNLINAQDFKLNKVGPGMFPFTDTCNQAYDSFFVNTPISLI